MAHHHTYDCIIVDKGRPRCQRSGLLVGDWWKRPYMRYGKQLTCDHGLKIFLVSGSYVRNNFDSDFVQGTGFTARYIPKTEIWIDGTLPRAEWHHFIVHECLVAEKLAKGTPAAKAYRDAKKNEDSTRRAESSRR